MSLRLKRILAVLAFGMLGIASMYAGFYVAWLENFHELFWAYPTILLCAFTTFSCILACEDIIGEGKKL